MPYTFLRVFRKACYRKCPFLKSHIRNLCLLENEPKSQRKFQLPKRLEGQEELIPTGFPLYQSSGKYVNMTEESRDELGPRIASRIFYDIASKPYIWRRQETRQNVSWILTALAIGKLMDLKHE